MLISEIEMGLFDTVYISRDVAASWDLRCPKCGQRPGENQDWQTKALDPCLCDYFLRRDDAGAIRLYLLDRPSDRRFWRPWTEQEIEESESDAKRDKLFAHWIKKKGGGCFEPEAYFPQNRRQRSRGELPHQWVEIYDTCECGEFIEYWIKFSDGIAVEVRSQEPKHEPGFFDDASQPSEHEPEF